LDTINNYRSSTNFEISQDSVTCFDKLPESYRISGILSTAFYISSSELIYIVLFFVYDTLSMNSLIFIASSPKLIYILSLKNVSLRLEITNSVS